MQAGVIREGQTVIVIDDLIATGMLAACPLLSFKYLKFTIGGSAKAAGELIAKQGGKSLEYLFIIELVSLKGGAKLDAPIYSIVQADD
jgi:adenine phosphoribosyltransferase